MQSNSPERLRIDKETLITFMPKDVPGLDLSETLFHLASPETDDKDFQTSELIIDADSTSSE
jgi:hypothetical protein